MLYDGERDFEIGIKLSDDAYYDKSVYHFQQAVEKFIKAIMISIGVFKKTHFVGGELRVLIEDGRFPEDWHKQLSEAVKISQEIEPAVSLSRYPGITDDALWLPYEAYKARDANNARQKAEKVRSIANRFVNDWFGENRQ